MSPDEIYNDNNNINDYDSYFSGETLERILHSVQQAKEGKIIIHDLIEV
ncbi:MAG: hypothetical protein IJT21_01015 [Synergistaceae bacterium]|nr:hypothetical protein [Synergistaceae bacterium]